MALYREVGIVLRTMRLGEADKIVTFSVDPATGGDTQFFVVLSD